MTDRPPIRKVVFTYDADAVLIDVVKETIPEAVVVVTDTDEDLRREIVDAQMTIGGSIEEDILAIARELVWHHVPWAGVEGIVTPMMAEKGMALTNSRGISAPNMAEHAIAFMLAFGRALPSFLEEQQSRSWRGWEQRPGFFELTGQTVLLLGTGAIGQAIATRLRPFGCRIIGANRTGGDVPGFDDIMAINALEGILPQVDHVVSSLPLTPFTRKIVDRKFIDAMKQGAYFYNVGRGGTVDQDALIVALTRGRLAGAGLDVTDPEPLPAESPLWDAPNVLITGHTSGASPMTAERSVNVLATNLKAYLNDDPLNNIVDLEFGY